MGAGLEVGLPAVGTDGRKAAKGFEEVGIEGCLGFDVEEAELAGGAKVVSCTRKMTRKVRGSVAAMYFAVMQTTRSRKNTMTRPGVCVS
jgi:hypothetical protein